MANTIGILDTSIGGLFNGVGDVIAYDAITDASIATAKLSSLANAMSLGDLFNGTVKYTGEAPTTESIKNEQGTVTYSYSEDGTFSYEAVIQNLNPAVTTKFLKGVVIADASLGASTWLASGATTVGFGHVIASQYLPMSWANREKNMVVTFPKALVTAELVDQDGGLGLKLNIVAQKLNTATLKTVMLSTAGTLNYTA